MMQEKVENIILNLKCEGIKIWIEDSNIKYASKNKYISEKN